MPIEYERIRPPKKGQPFPYKCRICGAPAEWKETFKSRDRRRRVTPRRVCDQCFEATGGVRAYLIGKIYRETKKEQGAPIGNANAEKQRANNLPFDSSPPKTAERIAEQFNVSPRSSGRTSSGSCTGRRRRGKAAQGQTSILSREQIICHLQKPPSASPSSSTSHPGAAGLLHREVVPGDEGHRHLQREPVHWWGKQFAPAKNCRAYRRAVQRLRPGKHAFTSRHIPMISGVVDTQDLREPRGLKSTI